MNDATDELISRVQLQCPTLITVEHPEFMTVQEVLAQDVPAAFVWLASDKAETAPETLMTTQQIIQTYGVWLVAPQESLEQVRSEVSAALLGWLPDATSDTCYYVKGETESLSGGLVWWREYWARPIWIRQ